MKISVKVRPEDTTEVIHDLMVSRLIKTEEDYSFALNRIEELMDAEAGTPEADELKLLTALVEAYEEQHYE